MFIFKINIKTLDNPYFTIVYLQTDYLAVKIDFTQPF